MEGRKKKPFSSALCLLDVLSVLTKKKRNTMGKKWHWIFFSCRIPFTVKIEKYEINLGKMLSVQ